MCERGTTTTIALKDGTLVDVDQCIVQIVLALNQGGLPTVGSCCGHGIYDGFVQLADGRVMWIRKVTA